MWNSTKAETNLLHTEHNILIQQGIHLMHGILDETKRGKCVVK